MEKRLLCCVEPFYDECLSGYLIRAAEINKYDKLVWIFSLSGLNVISSLLQNTSTNLNYILKENVSLNQLSMLTGLSEETLYALTFHEVFNKDPYLCSINQKNIHKEVMVVNKCKICVECIKQYGYIKKVWSLAFYTVCTEHKCMLVDQCLDCGKNIGWNRNSLGKCNCGSELTKQKITPISAGEEVVSELLIYKCGYSNTLRNKSLFNVLDLYSLNRILRLLFSLYNMYEIKGSHHLAHYLTNKEIHEFIKKINTLILHWPQPFYDLLDTHLKVSSNKSLYQSLKFLLQFLFKDNANNTMYSFIRREIEEYLVVNWTYINMNASSLRTMSSVLTRKNGEKYITASTIPVKYGIPTMKLRDLLDSKVIEGSYKQVKEHYIYLIKESSLDEYKNRGRNKLKQKDLKKLFHTSNEGVISLCTNNVIEYTKDSRQYLFDKDKIENFQKQLDSKVDYKYKKNTKIIKLRVAQFIFSEKNNNGLGKVIKLMQDNELVSCGINDCEQGLFKYCFYYEDILNYLERSEKIISLERIGDIYNLSSHAIEQLAQNGYLGEIIKKHVVRFVKVEVLKNFPNRIISLSKISKLYRSTVEEVKQILNKNNLSPIYGMTIKDTDKILYDHARVDALFSNLIAID